MTRRLFGISLPFVFSAALAFAGCNTDSPPSATVGHKDGDGHGHATEHDHPSEGPHHGHLIELGEEVRVVRHS